MKQNFNFILYGAALVVILIPVLMNEAFHRPIGQPGESIMLSAGLLLLLIGKILLMGRKRRETGESIFLDVVISLCLIAMIVWMFLR